MKTPKSTAYFTYENPNPRGKATSDCVIRAIAIATGKPWGEVLDDLVALSKKTGYMVNDRKCYEKYLTAQGYVKCKQPRKSDGKKFTGIEFCEYAFNMRHPSEITAPVVAHIGSHHLTVFVPARPHLLQCRDTWNPTYGCVGNYWIKDC